MYQSSIYHTHHISMFSESNHNISFYIAYESQLEKGVTNPKYFSNTRKKNSSKRTCHLIQSQSSIEG